MPATHLVLNLLGSSVSITLTDPEGIAGQMLARALVDLTVGDPPLPVRSALRVTRRAGHYVLVDEDDDSVIAHHRDGRAFVTQVVHRLNRLALDLDPLRLHLHAAAVVRVDGTGVLIVGASGAGKSTLTTDLLLHGGADTHRRSLGRTASIVGRPSGARCQRGRGGFPPLCRWCSE